MREFNIIQSRFIHYTKYNNLNKTAGVANPLFYCAINTTIIGY